MPDTGLIAVIDDDASSRQAVCGLVQALGFSTLSFGCAEDFLASPVEVGCLIVDVRMPGMSGLDLVRHLAATRHLGSVILMTAHPDETTSHRAIKAGIRCYLAKPIRPEELLACLQRALAAKTPAR